MLKLPTTQELVAAIDAFLVRHDMRPTRFGRDATGEPQLLDSLRNGRSPSLDTAGKIADFMANRDAERAIRVEHAGGDTVPLSATSSEKSAHVFQTEAA